MKALRLLHRNINMILYVYFLSNDRLVSVSLGEENPCARVTCPWGGACISRGGSAQCACPVCDATLAPVCASDHNTYGSECKMRMHACQEGIKEGDLKVLYNGTCRK